MWPFSRRKEAHSCPTADEVARIRAHLTEIQLEWTEVLDKLAAWTNRQAARDAARVKKGLKQLETDANVDPEAPAAPRNGDRTPAGPPVPPEFKNLHARGNELRRRDGLFR